MSHKPPLIPPSAATHTATPHENDVLCGRGGTINAHPGNEQYRHFVDRKKRVYLTARFKREKRLISSSIVNEIRNLDPPGRFLMKDPQNSDLWYDVGDEKARDKTSQALRENALSVRKAMEEEFQETRRRQAREVAIAAGRDPEEAVQNMMSGLASTKEKKQISAPPPVPGMPPASAGPAPPAGFVGRSGYGPLYAAQQPVPPQPAVPAVLDRWGYHGSAPPPPAHAAPQPGYDASHPPLTQQQQQPDAPHHPPPRGSSCTRQHNTAPPQHLSRYLPPPPPQGLYPFHPASTSHGMQQQPSQYVGHPPPQPQSHHPSTHQYPPHYNANWNQQQQAQHHSHPSPHEQQHAISKPMLRPRNSFSQPPTSVPQPSPSIPAIAVGDPLTIEPIHIYAGTTSAASTPPPSGALALAPLIRHPQHASPSSNRHVQFQKDPLAAGKTSDARSGGTKDIPLVIRSKHRDQLRKTSFATATATGESSPDPTSSQISATLQSSPSTQGQPRSPKSQATMATGSTGETPLALLSGDMSVWTADSFSHYLKGIEDEISGDVGQEVELVAHAPMLPKPATDLPGYRDSGIGSKYSRSGGVDNSQRSNSSRHSRKSGFDSSQRSTGSRSSRHSRRRKKRGGTHIPSNSGKVQVDWSTAPGRGAPTPAHEGGIVCGMRGPGTIIGQPDPVVSSSANPCSDGNAVSASCGVILPTPLKSSNSGPNRSPTTFAMAPPPGLGIPPLPSPSRRATGSLGMGAVAPSHHAMSPGAPLSPSIHSLELEKMSLCGTENVSHTGGSIGGASLCNVFDDTDESAVGANNLMDMTMSLGSNQSTGQSNPSSEATMGLKLCPRPVGGDERSTGTGLMDMSVGSGVDSRSKNYSGSSRGSAGSSSGKSKSSGGVRSHSPASIDKGALSVEESREQPPQTQAYGHDFKFSWDGKREE